METIRLPHPGEAGASSNVAIIGYCEPSQVLEVEFHNGSVYHYYRVEKALWEEFKAIKSKGNFIHARLKGRHYQQVKPVRTPSPADQGTPVRPQDKRRRKSEETMQRELLEVFARTK